jgi:hypothetical protein
MSDKINESKRREVGFGGKVLTDAKSARFILRPIQIQPIMLFLFVLILGKLG